MSRDIPKDKLRKAFDHLVYELWMVQEVVKLLLSGMDSRPLNNALLESFGIHVRALIHFFYDDDGQRDDVLAVHFFSTPYGWEKLRPPYSDEMRKAKKRVDKEIAHLTYTRQKVTSETKKWHFGAIAEELKGIAKVFISSVPKELLVEQLKTTSNAP